jgi:DNA polymerase-3 subunit beta
MEFVVEQPLFARALQTASRVVNPQNTVPALSGLLLSIRGSELTITATDMVSEIRTTIPVRGEEDGEIVLPAGTLTELVARVPAAELRVLADGPGTRATVSWGRSRIDLQGFRPEDRPGFPGLDRPLFRMTMPPGSLPRIARQTLFACARDDTRPILKGVYMTLTEGKLVWVSTDGTRLSHSWVPLPELADSTATAVVSSRAVQEAARLAGLEPVIVEGDGHLVRFTTEQGTMTTVVLEGRYPDYERVLPPAYVTSLRAPAALLKGAVDRAALLAHRDRSASIRVKYAEGQLEVSTEASELGQTYEVLDVAGEGREIDLSFSPTLLVDALKSIESDDLVWEFAGPQMPARLSEADNPHYFHIVLPLRQLV